MVENTHILTEEITPYLDAAKFEFVVSNLPLVRASRIRSPKNPEDRARRLAAEVALRRLLREVGEDYRALTVAYTETGKPYFEGRRDLTFSLSPPPHWHRRPPERRHRRWGSMWRRSPAANVQSGISRSRSAFSHPDSSRNSVRLLPRRRRGSSGDCGA